MKEFLGYLNGVDKEVLIQLIKYMTVAVVFMVFDIITGLTAAKVTGTYKSKVMREGGRHKLSLLLAIVFGVLLDVAQAVVDIGISLPATLLICLYIIIMEIGSCKENITKAYNKALPASVANAIDDAVNNMEGGPRDEND